MDYRLPRLRVPYQGLLLTAKKQGFLIQNFRAPGLGLNYP